VIVCGHYGCGGIAAAYAGSSLGLIDNWLRHAQDVMQKHQAVLAGLPGDGERLERLCELNVVEQVINVGRTTIVQRAWEGGQRLAIHGWIYSLRDGLLRDLRVSAAGPADLDAAARGVSARP
jgi:carbonic anhydrase